MNRKAVYAGSFDPPTLGHIDILKRVAPLFDEVHIVIARNARKQGWLSPDERVALLKGAVDAEGISHRVVVSSFEGLVVDYCKRVSAQILIRGLRAMSDFETELQMASMNRRLAPEIETMAVMTDEKYHYVSSSLIREIFQYGTGLEGLVPANVEIYLKERASHASFKS